MIDKRDLQPTNPLLLSDWSAESLLEVIVDWLMKSLRQFLVIHPEETTQTLHLASDDEGLPEVLLLFSCLATQQQETFQPQKYCQVLMFRVSDFPAKARNDVLRFWT